MQDQLTFLAYTDEEFFIGENMTVREHLVSLFYRMNHRCSHHKLYVGKSIECRFETVAELESHVTDELDVDPRGLDCHRIDNNGHYEPGNIEFLTKADHSWIHAGVSRAKCCEPEDGREIFIEYYEFIRENEHGS